MKNKVLQSYNILTLSWLLCLCLSIASIAQTQRFNGEILEGNFLWSGTVIIAGDVVVEKGSRLEIEPGTTVLFEAGTDMQKSGEDKSRSELIIRGTLVARGLPGKRITFSSRSAEPRMGDWYGLSFLHLEAGSIMEYCVVEYAYNGVIIKNSVMLVSNCELRYNYHSGIKAEVKAKPTIQNNILSENGFAGIICELGAEPVLTENIISLNRIGVVSYSLSKPNLGSLKKDKNYNPGKNHIFNNEDYNLYNHSTKTISAENNAWDSQKSAEIVIKVYDKEDNDKYGPVDFEPALVVAEPGALLAQNSSIAIKDTTTNMQNNSNLAGGIKKSRGDSTRPGLTTIIKDEKGSTTDPGKAYSVSLGETTPLIASNAPSSQIVPTSKRAIAEQIDYDQIFLELFLDGAKKEYKSKPKFKINNVLRNVLEAGEIRIRVIVARSGRVDQAHILKGINDILDQAVLETVKKYRYKSGKVNGQAVKFSTTEVFRFE